MDAANIFNILFFCLLLKFCQAARIHPREECFIEGACVNSFLIEERQTTDANACHDFCKSLSECLWFTYYPDNSLCLALTNCDQINTANYTGSISGQSTCDQFQCGIQGRCKGTVVHVASSHLQQGCLDICLDWNAASPDNLCEWFTYNEADNGCFLFSECPLIDEECLTCVSGQSKCATAKAMTKLLIGSGMPISVSGNQFEILDLSQPPKPGNFCQVISEFPSDVFGAVGVVIPPSEGGSSGSPLICGGFSNDKFQPVYETACYQLPPVSSKSNWSTSEGWDRTTDMGIQGRLFASATTLLDNGLVNDYIWWVTGGTTDDDKPLKTTEIRHLNGTWTSGPLLQEPVFAHCLVQVLRHKSILIGGTTPLDSFSRKVSGFDWNTKAWNEETSLLIGRYGHVCGQLRETAAGNGEFPSKILVAGGMGLNPTNSFDGRKPLASVEIYDSTTKLWTAGPELPNPVFGAAMVQYGLDEVLLIGGGNDDTVYDTILSLSSTNMVWRVLEHKMSSPRYSHVAFLVPDTVITPPCDEIQDMLDDNDLIEEFNLEENQELTIIA